MRVSYLSKAEFGTKWNEMTLPTTHVLESTPEAMSPCTINPRRPRWLTMSRVTWSRTKTGRSRAAMPPRRMLRSLSGSGRWRRLELLPLQ
jgi:hypothetical protein